MAIDELWIASPNYGAANPQKIKGALHTTQGADTIQALGNWFANPDAQCSSHHGADNYTTVFGAYVYEDCTAWCQGGMNGVTECIELCGYAEWSRDTWLGQKLLLTQNASRWVRYMSDKYSIPMVALNSSQAQDTWTKGFCQHVDFGSKGSGHWDCGDGFPMDKVLEWAKGGTVSGGNADMSPAIAIWNNKEYYAWIDNGKVMYRGPDTKDKPVVIDPNAGAIAGCDMNISPGGWSFVTFTNSDGDPYVLRRAPEGAGGWERFRIALQKVTKRFFQKVDQMV
jgi:hypothetical protein